MILPPLKPTWKRYFKIFWKSDLSIYRTLLYEELEHIKFTGRTLDFGGGSLAPYCADLTARIVSGSYESANIDPGVAPNYLIGRDGSLPLEEHSFDTVLSLNTLEYMFDLPPVLHELVRVIKPGGQIVLGVPFLFRVHGTDDYQRPTAHWWQRALENAGMNGVLISPLSWDFMTTGLSVTEGGGPLRKFRRVLVPLYGIAYAVIRSRGSGKRYSEQVAETINNVALGYMIRATKMNPHNDFDDQPQAG
jgi:SAM-dependent methyltransferase